MTYKAISSPPGAGKYPNLARWYKHIASFEPEFSTLPGDSSKPYTSYGPEDADIPVNVKAAQGGDDDDDLFGSDSEEEDPEVAKERERKLAEYKKKKEAKPKEAAKSMVTMEVKPWGMQCYHRDNCLAKTGKANFVSAQMMRQIWRS